MFDLFHDLTWAGAGVQLLGFVAMGAGVMSFQARRRVAIIALQVAASALWTTQFALLGGTLGALMNGLCILRGAAFASGERWRWARHPATLWGFCALFVGVGLWACATAWDWLPIVGTVVSSVALFRRDPQRLRRWSLLSSPPWLVYDAWAGTLAGVCCEVFNLTSILVALWRFRERPAAPGETPAAPPAPDSPASAPGANAERD